MRRLLLCLPVCLVFISGLSSTQPGAKPSFRDVDDNGGPLPSQTAMEELAKTNPIAFLEACIRRYDREVKGYTATLYKQERLAGQLERTEVIDVAFRDEPFSVLMKWREGTRRANAVLYVKGENQDQLLVRPSGVFAVAGVVKRDPNGPDAKKAGRYPLPEFGIKIALQRTLTSWQRAAKKDALHVEYLGAKRIKETGGRRCWILRRTRYEKPEEEGITELTTYIDTETWLQLGTVLKNSEGQLIASYFFRDVHLNPTFKPDTFSPEALKR